MSNKKPALGRGLSALLNNVDTDLPLADKKIINPLGSVSSLRISQIETNPLQPRTQFDQTALAELASSIKELGIIQPVTVRKVGFDKFQLISGERRFRASQLADLKEIPAYIRVANDQTMLEMALVENIQRENLDAIEIAISYQRLIEECELTQEEMSQRVGKKRSTITNYLRLLKLPAEIQLGIRSKNVSMGHARALVGIENLDTQLKIYTKIIENGLSVRQVEELSKKKKRNTTSDSSEKSQEDGLNSWSFHHQKFIEDLNAFLNTKAKIEKKSNGAGKVTIPFKSIDELERIIDLMDL